MAMSDAEIRRGLQSGEPSACEALVQQYHERVFRLLWADTGDPDDAADLAQETFIAVWSRPKLAARAENLEAWLCGVALKRAHALRRRLLRRRSLLTAVPDPTAGPGSADATQHLQQAELLRAVRTLHPRYRHPLLLHTLEGLPHREVAQALGISETTARWRVSEARRRLRVELSEDEEEGSDVACAACAE